MRFIDFFFVFDVERVANNTKKCYDNNILEKSIEDNETICFIEGVLYELRTKSIRRFEKTQSW